MRASIVALACVGAAWDLSAAKGEIDFGRVREAALADIASGAMPGLSVTVVHDGRVAFAEAFGVANVETGAAVTPDTLFQVGSAGKMLTAAAVVQVAAAERRSLDEPIERVVRGLDAAIAELTLHQLLSQTSGLRDMPGEHGEQNEEAHGRFVRSLTAADRLLAPGQTFSYSNIGYSLAGFVAAEAARVGYAELMATRVFQPVGMTGSTIRPAEAMKRPLAMGHVRGEAGTHRVVRPLANDTRLWPAGYAYSTAGDVARFTIALMDGGRIGNRQVLLADTARRLLMGHTPLPNVFAGGHYGYGLLLFAFRGVNVAEHAGSMPGYAAVVRMVPERRFAVIALANGEAPPLRTVEAAMEAVLALTPPAPPPADGPPISMTVEEMSAYAGRYENRGAFEVAVEKGALVLRQNDGPALPLSKVGPDRFVAEGPNNRRLRFVLKRAEAGRPAYLHFALWGFRKVS